MIVVLGCPAALTTDTGVVPAGLAGWIAIAAARAGAPTEVVGRIGDDDRGDRVILAFAAAGVGHAALLRDPAHGTPLVTADDDWSDDPAADDPAADDQRAPELSVAPSVASADAPTLDADDVALGLRYLTDFSVLVIADLLDAGAARAAIDAAGFAGARTVAVVEQDTDLAADTRFLVPSGDHRSFAEVVGRYAAALARGEDETAALAAAARASGWTAPDQDASSGSITSRP